MSTNTIEEDLMPPAFEYPIPCDCGRRTMVHPSQAGSEIDCSCGKSLAVPSLSELRRMAPTVHSDATLKTVADEPDRLPAGLVGVALVIAADAVLLTAPPNTLAVVYLLSIVIRCIGTGLFARMRRLPFWVGSLLGLLGTIGIVALYCWHGREK